jgi:hypothetical protein
MNVARSREDSHPQGGRPPNPKTDGLSPGARGLKRREFIWKYVLLVGFGMLGFPELVAKYPWGLPVPIQNAGTIIIVLFALRLCVFRLRNPTKNRIGGLQIMLVLVVVYAVFLGLAHRHSANFVWYFFVRELAFCALCISGMVIGFRLPYPVLVRLMFFLLGAVSALLILFSVLMSLGVVGPGEWASGRLIDLSLFGYANTILILMPIVAKNSNVSPRRLLRVIGFAVSALLYFTIISATRSLFIATIISLLLTLFCLARRYSVIAVGTRYWYQGAIALIAVLCLTIAADVSLIKERFSETDIRDDPRFIEIGEFLEQRANWFPEGAGMGVGFETIVSAASGLVGNEGGMVPMVNAPHVGVFVWIVKAGIVGLVFTSALCFVGVRAVFKRGGKKTKTADFYLGLVMVLVIGCISGGWNTVELLLTGIVVGVGQRQK